MVIYIIFYNLIFDCLIELLYFYDNKENIIRICFFFWSILKYYNAVIFLCGCFVLYFVFIFF